MARAGRRTTGSRRSHTQAQSRFARIPGVKIPRSVFNRSCGHKTTFMAGYLIPIFVDEVLPGDTFTMRSNIFARMATPLFPVMDNLYLDTFFFFVPNRLVWDNWEAFNGQETTPQGGQGTQYQVPETITVPGACTIYDYFGWPTNAGVAKLGNVLPFRAYNLIWNEWFRDENLQSPLVVNNDSDGPDDAGDYALQYRGKRHDYFTSCLPFPQKGPDVQIPLGQSAPVTGIAEVQPAPVPTPTFDIGGSSNLTLRGGGSISPAEAAHWSQDPGAENAAQWSFSGLITDADHPAATLAADLTSATATTINQMRELFQWQRMYERDARGGTRYTEIIRSHFGVVSPDARLQRPEYLGGGSTRINVNPVATTTEDPNPPDPDKQPGTGDLSAFVTAFAVNGWMKSFTEHGFVIGLANVRADLTYQQGMERFWHRRDRFDYFWPSLAHLGEQGVEGREIYCDGTPGDTEVFGYQERYAEYRYKPSRTSGLMRTNNDSGTDLDVWHLALDFVNRPLLNAQFIQDNPPINRVIRVDGEQHFLMDAWFQYRCARPMPTYSVPGLIDHF